MMMCNQKIIYICVASNRISAVGQVQYMKLYGKVPVFVI